MFSLEVVIRHRQADGLQILDQGLRDKTISLIILFRDKLQGDSHFTPLGFTSGALRNVLLDVLCDRR